MRHSSRRSRRHRNPQSKENQVKPFFSKTNDTGAVQTRREGSFFQAKLTIGQPGDKYEKEADATADAVVNRTGKGPAVQKMEGEGLQRVAISTPMEDEKLGTAEGRMRRDQEIQEKPEAGGGDLEKNKEEARMQPEDEEMAQEKKEAGEEEEMGMAKIDDDEAQLMEEEPEKQEDEGVATAQTKPDPGGGNQVAGAGLSGKVKDAKGKGRPIPETTRVEMESSFGVALDSVKVHTGKDAEEMNRSLHAQAFTVGEDIFFNSGKFNPENTSGKHLLAHELTHVLQQNGGEIRTKKKVGKKFEHQPGAVSPYKVISGTFDGKWFKLLGDGKEIYSVEASSGRPYTVSPADAKKCGGQASDSYMNNPLYVGIKDNGPIPEGTYVFSATRIGLFDAMEQLQIMSGSEFTDPFGQSMHGGDWGAGRVPLQPVSIKPGPKGCGNTSSRSGFYLHGGIMPGSSGCIDVGNSGFRDIAKQLQGHKGKVRVQVQYTQPAPQVNALQRALGRFTYPGQENPTLGQRIKAFFGGGSN